MKKNEMLYNELVAEEKKNWGNNQSMIDYCVGKVSGVVKLSCGAFFVVDKPDIKKDFCFDDSFDDGSDTDSDKLANYARTHEDYFLSENLKGFDENIKEAEEALSLNDDNFYCMMAVGTNGHMVNDHVYYDKYFEEYHWRIDNKVFLTKDDVKAIRDLFVAEKEKFEKRLHSYLKRYGLSKLNVWTYWGMA